MDQSVSSLSDSVGFIPSQVGRTLQTPIAYTGDPFKLMWSDFKLVCRVWTTVPGILWPVRYGKRAEVWDELYPNAPNMYALVLHIFLVPVQAIFLLSIPALMVIQIPALWVIIYVGLFIFANDLLCKTLNGSKLVLEPSKSIIFPPRDDEYWIFLNGVAVG